ncbi:LacI family DNA-binding transcriptional regulator [Paenibacillus polymyxa]|uniref:Transcriptional regulator n=1 Tax=Paenibacillus polymyxa (strain SC2) TaxID=886882 RepID=E3EIS9_PAEPS|nr:LacI family DNA-binding transcriptional regulator [Paenibacillus polymyxa]ADO55948.1 transcriptional regulator [Paenibacillus polymyxa SC2]MEE4568258.1 LacI family DNA-binding transcriptional regulator [Paenibacillus polymyxa]WPQ58659.1 LacI family DNA-binding transcriptional regulator [Paenibacillus polymyxa]CCC84716.1 HTH-type transcriptional repressor purR [Paenibacillus polymyxa M1]
MRGKVTLQEIADAAGVSKFAVSRALSGKPGVSEETRALLVKLAAQMGYFRSHPKMTGVEPRDTDAREWSGTVLVLFPNIRHQNRESKYWGPVFEGISERLNRRGLDMITLTEPSTDDMFSLLNPEAIKGIITVGTISTTLLLNIYRMGIPVVMVDHWDSAFLSDAVFTDNRTCMNELMKDLLCKGYDHFQFVGHIDDAHSFYERWEAFRSTLEMSGVELRQNKALIYGGAQALAEEMDKLPEDELPEVFVCANDVTASQVVEVLKGKGIDVPRRCGVTGFDDTNDQMPIYATVRVDKELLGMRAVDQLLWRIMNPNSPVEKKLLHADLLVREVHAPRLSRENDDRDRPFSTIKYS